MLNLEYLHVIFEIETDDGIEDLPGEGLSLLPSVGDEIEMNYVHGKKITFKVIAVKHHLSSIGENMLQQIKVIGKEI